MERCFFSSALRFHAAVGFGGNRNNMKTVKALHLVVQASIAFSTAAGFQPELWYTVEMKCFVAKGYPICARLYWEDKVMEILKGLTPKQLLMERKSDM